MKNCTFLVLILCSFFCAKAQTTEIIGISKKTKAEQVKLFSVAHGQIKEIEAVNTAVNGAFSFKFNPSYKGYYLVGFGTENSREKDKFKLYVKGNEQINLELNDSGYLLTGKNSKENRVLEKWYRTVDFNRGQRTFNDFIPLLENVIAKTKNWTTVNQTANADFDQLMKRTVRYDLANYVLALLLYPSASILLEEDYPPYLKNFDADQFLRNEDLLQFPYGMNMLNNLVAFKNRGLGYDFDKNIMSIPNDSLKGDYALNYMAIARSYTKYRENVEKYSKYFLRDDQKRRAEEIEASMAIYKQGTKAIEFSYPDINGNLVSLSDFKGKVVLIDIWATWCKPCISQIPWLKRLEEEFHGQDVVFISICVNDHKDKESWMKFVKNEHLGGVQIFAGAQSQIEKDYKVNGIPRFMLFDKNGNIIDVDAARPSNPKLKEVLKKWL